MSETLTANESLSGTVIKITYRNEDNGYTVLILQTDSGEDYTVVGIMPYISEGDYINCDGEFVYHQSYGEQLKAARVEREVRRDAASVLRYLSAGSVKGIGPVTARLIVERFGEKTLDILEKDYMRLAEIKGITQAKAQAIHEEYVNQFGLQEILLYLSPFSVTSAEALNIYRKFGVMAVNFIKENPYVLCCEDISFSFERAEEIAAQQGFAEDRIERIQAGITYILKKNLGNGHTCLPRNKLTKVAVSLLDISSEGVEIAIDSMLEAFSLIQQLINGEPFVFLPDYYNAERKVSGRLMAVRDNIPEVFPISELEIENCENKMGIKFDQKQKNAIASAVENGLLILTGGPGTGKTTTLKAIINILEHRDLKLILAAPTGRAAKRMTELTGKEAKTIHRLLECSFEAGGKIVFSKNETNPLECDAIIIDEMSMVDVLLFEKLIRALRYSCRIIMVGDSDQLPSVGAGNVLADMLSSGCIPAVKLDTVFRQSLQSRIITAAHAIIGGQAVELKNSPETDFFFVRKQSASATVDTVIELVTERLPAAYGLSKTEDIQVLCPSRKLDGGSYNLNNLLQAFLNPSVSKKPEMAYKGVYYRIGDKVMQVKNNYDISWKKENGEEGSGIFNGDIGFITDIDKRAGYIQVRFEDRYAEYQSEQIGELELAYAVTVHKSQGSEFECVVIPLFDVPQMLRYRNLLYTGVTRAKKLLVVVGKEEIFAQMAANDRKTLRYTALTHFLSEAAR